MAALRSQFFQPMSGTPRRAMPSVPPTGRRVLGPLRALAANVAPVAAQAPPKSTVKTGVKRGRPPATDATVPPPANSSLPALPHAPGASRCVHCPGTLPWGWNTLRRTLLCLTHHTRPFSFSHSSPYPTPHPQVCCCCRRHCRCCCCCHLSTPSPGGPTAAHHHVCAHQAH